MKRPARKSLPAEVAKILATEIRNNRWGKTLPGYRPLCSLLGVGRRAVEGALKILTEEQVLLPANGTRSRQINPNHLKHGDQPKRIRTVAAIERENLNHTSRTILSNLQISLGRKWNFEHRKSHAFHLKRPDKVLDQLVEKNPDCRWIFIDPSFAVAKWLECRTDLDTICLGGDVHGSGVRCLAVSFSDLVTAQIEHLLAIGHRKICTPCHLTSPVGKRVFTEKIKTLFEAHNSPFSSEYNLPQFNASPESLRLLLSKLFSTTSPSAIVALNFDWYMTILSFSHQYRIRIPYDLSLALCADDPLVEWLHPRPTTIEHPVSKFVTALNHWAILGPTKAPIETTNFKPKPPILGETIARPAR